MITDLLEVRGSGSRWYLQQRYYGGRGRERSREIGKQRDREAERQQKIICTYLRYHFIYKLLCLLRNTTVNCGSFPSCLERVYG